MEEKKEQKYVKWYQAKYVYAKHMNALPSIVYLYRRLLATLMKTSFTLSWEIRPQLGKYFVKIEHLTLLCRVAGL